MNLHESGKKKKKKERKKEGRKKFDRGLIRFAHWKKEGRKKEGKEGEVCFPRFFNCASIVTT